MNQHGFLKIYLTRSKRILAHIACFTAVTNILMLVPSIYMLQIYDRVLSSGNTFTLWMLTILMISLIFLIGGLEYIRQIVLLYLGSGLDKETAPRVYSAVFQQKLTGSSQAQVNALDDLSTLRQFITGQAPAAFFDLPWFPIYLIVLYSFHPLLGHFALCSAAILVLFAYLNEKLAANYMEKAMLVGMAANYQFQTQLQHVESAHALGIRKNLQARWLGFQESFIESFVGGSKRTTAFTHMSKSLRMIVQSGVLGLGAWLVIEGQITAGMMIAASILLGRVLAPVDQLIMAWKQWISARHAYARLNDLLSGTELKKTKIALPAPTGALTVSGLVSAPPGVNVATLRGISFALQPGDILAVSGDSGSGKSTLARVLLNIWPAAQGKIYLDKSEIKHWDQQELSQYLGYVSQDSELFSGSIRANISRMADDNDEAVIKAAQEARAHELIMSLPQGYETILGENGRGLSGGQKQKIALARACYLQPKIIILDEPDTSLDKQALAELKQILQSWSKQQVTIILISHDTDLISIANKSLALKQGMQTFFGDNPSFKKTTRSLSTSYPSASNISISFKHSLPKEQANG